MFIFKAPPSCFWHRPWQYGCQRRGLLCLSGFIDPTCADFYIAPHYVSTILRNASVLTFVPLCCGLVCFMFVSLRRLVSVLRQQQRGCRDSWLTDCKLLYYSPLGVIKTPIIVTAPQFTDIWCTVTRIRGELDRFGYVFKHGVWTGDRLAFWIGSCLSVWFFLFDLNKASVLKSQQGIRFWRKENVLPAWLFSTRQCSITRHCDLIMWLLECFWTKQIKLWYWHESCCWGLWR